MVEPHKMNIDNIICLPGELLGCYVGRLLEKGAGADGYIL